MSLRTMQWDERVWKVLMKAVTPMPIFVRKKALKKIIEASEENAKKRGSSIVEEKDFVKAAKEKVPSIIKPICFRALKEEGIEIEE